MSWQGVAVGAALTGLLVALPKILGELGLGDGFEFLERRRRAKSRRSK